MRESVFVDSFAWIASINKSDNYHKTSLKTIETLVSGLLLAALWAIVDKTKMGKAIRAVADDSEFYLFDEPTACVKRNLDDS
jgi:branched-subunit amino acid ABC-type transport system permease component